MEEKKNPSAVSSESSCSVFTVTVLFPDELGLQREHYIVFLKAAVSKAITFFFNPKKTHITFSDTVFGEDSSNYCSVSSCFVTCWRNVLIKCCYWHQYCETDTEL